MRKALFIAALASAALVSCSKDEVVNLNQDEIKFSVVADNATKAAHVYCSNNLMTSFNVTADFDNVVYIENDAMTVSAANNVTYTEATTKRYWPAVSATLPMKFYAIADGSMDDNRSADNAPKVTDFEVKDNVAQQEDLLYAVKEVTTKPGNGILALNFRHALSLIEFRAQKTNASINVTISGVKVGNVINKGTFTFPTNVEHEDNESAFASTAALSAWNQSTDASDIDSYEVDLNAEPVVLDATVKALTYLNHSGSTTANKSMILLPQTLSSPWEPTSGVLTSGSYLAVKCTITNADDNNTLLYEDKWAYIPLGAASSSPTWEPGKKYVYTFVFGTGNAGYDEEGKPVLTPISYTVSVDDFDAFADGNSPVTME